MKEIIYLFQIDCIPFEWIKKYVKEWIKKYLL